MAGLVSSILDKVHYLQKKETFIQHQRLWGFLTFSKYKRDTDLILWALVETPRITCVHRRSSVSGKSRLRTTPIFSHAHHPARKQSSLTNN